MAKGLLTIQGTLDLVQFWPDGESDADTTKVKITVAAGAIRFQPKKSAPAQVTTAFDGAWLKTVGGKKTVIDTKGRVTVRLQGIDAPELHYAPAPVGRSAAVTDAMRAALKAVNHKYRQHHGQSATLALLTMLKKAGAATLPCTFQTAVDHPNDVCDKYARVVGDVVVDVNGKKVNINRWVLEQGWAVPSYYNSMSAAEITALQKLAAKARAAGKGIWNDYRSKFGKFDFQLLYVPGKKSPGFAVGGDAGTLIMPKLFRRQTTWACYKEAGITALSFAQYLAGLKERFYETADYLANGDLAMWQQMAKKVKAGEFLLGPGDMVFEEAASTLYSAAGVPVTVW